MPFDVWISRCSSPAEFEALDGPSITEDEFHALLQSGPSELQPDGVYRIRRRDGRPWLTARFDPRRRDGGDIALSVSYTTPNFLRDWSDSFQLATALAAPIAANVFEETTLSAVTPQTLPALVDPDSPLLQRHVGLHREHTAELAQRGGVPLEYALGGVVDSTGIALCLKLQTPQPALLDWLRDDPLALAPVRSDAGYLLDGGVPLLRVLCRPDGVLQIWGAYGPAPFSQWAPAAVELTDRMRAAHGGQARLVGFGPFEGAIRRAVEPRLDGLGTDFVVWALQRH